MLSLRWFVIYLSVALLLIPAPLHAQEQRFAVLVRDVSGNGVASVTIQINNTEGEMLATTTTDANGGAFFPEIEATMIRVLVRGFLSDGTPLRQLGDDAEGIAFINDSPGLVLDLRVEPDGSVLPDPSTMITLDTASIDNTSPIPEAPASGSVPQSTVVANTSRNPSQEVSPLNITTQTPAEEEIPYIVLTFTNSQRVVYKKTNSFYFGDEIANFLVDNDALTIEGLNKAGEDKMVALYSTRPPK